MIDKNEINPWNDQNYCFIFSATIKVTNELVKQNLGDFGRYVAECLPKYIQKVQIATGDELELLIAPEGVLPVLQFLKDHHNCQFSNLSDLCAVDVPQRVNRFEVKFYQDVMARPFIY